MSYHLGLDIGSVSIDTILLNDRKEIVEESYTRTKGQPLQTAVKILNDLLNSYPKEEICSISTTGSGGKLIAKLLKAKFINEVLALTKGTAFLYPDIRTIIEIGGEDSKLIIVDKGIIKDFSMNTVCAAGTGSFLDQQATRLKVNIENEFAQLALKSKNPPRIAGRCSVFAKSDMIHLQQVGTPDYDIIAGLCYALARSFVSNIVKGKKLEKPISFQGGVAFNQGMIKAFEDILGLKNGELIIPSYRASLGALGAALEGMSANIEQTDWVQSIENYISSEKASEESLKQLNYTDEETVIYEKPGFEEGEKIDAYIGVDIGSLSTNVVAIDKNKKLLARIYLRTSGRPIEAVKEGMKIIDESIGGHLYVKGACTTGSGRYLTGMLIGADLVKNEITAQARATIEIDPKVDTIFEIGGQDSKYISIKDGAVVDFEMNKVCAAGTGSFLEEQAEKLDISIVKEFGKKACSSKCPSALGERCTVFMESDLNSHKQNGSSRDDLVAGLSYSIVLNYLNRVVCDKKIGDNIYFQGAVAFNKGVVAAFREITGKPIKVTPNNDVTGAIGAAILAMENAKGKSKFRGFKEIVDVPYKQKVFECHSCSNICEIKSVTFGNEKPVFYGSRCEKYDVDKNEKDSKIPDLFKERMELLLKEYPKQAGNGKAIGLPLALNFYELYPMWNAFFAELGFKVVHSTPTNKQIIEEGLNSIAAETCFPVKVMHGHISDLLGKKVDCIFLPSVINARHINKKLSNSYNCPYVQAIPHIISSAMGERLNIPFLQPVFHFQYGPKLLKKQLIKFGLTLGKTKKELKGAIKKAFEFQEEFYKKLEERGSEILENLPAGKKTMVIISRPYNGCDSALNLDLPKKLSSLGILTIPMDYLPVDKVDISPDFGHMYWRYGQKIIAAAEIIKHRKNLFAIYMTNFGCGPDSFVMRLFNRKAGKKPTLFLEVDEHSADAGAITRCEAFLDSIENAEKVKIKDQFVGDAVSLAAIGKERAVYIPYMGDAAYGLKAALQANGYKAEVIKMADDNTMSIGRKYTDGKECLPMIITTGDMMNMTKQPGFDRNRAAFFMGRASGPCRFGQYSKMQRVILDEAGYGDIPIVTLTSEDSYLGMGTKFKRLVWNAIVAIDVLGKMLRHIRPYELNEGESNKTYKKFIEKMSNVKSVKEIRGTLEEALAEFKKINLNKTKRKPLIGLVGEIYVRNHEFANSNIIDKIEKLGGEVWLTPVSEWFSYVNLVAQEESIRTKNLKGIIKFKVEEKIMSADEHKLLKIFEEGLKGLEEPSTRQTVLYSKAYLPSSSRIESVLSMGKSVDFVKKGCAGIINAIPFNCMPGNITTALAKKFTKDNNNIPTLTMAYDGMKQKTSDETRLEAFMHQARQYIATIIADKEY